MSITVIRSTAWAEFVKVNSNSSPHTGLKPLFSLREKVPNQAKEGKGIGGEEREGKRRKGKKGKGSERTERKGRGRGG